MPTVLLLVRHAQPFVPRPGGPDDYRRSLTREGFAAAERLVGELAGVAPVAVLSSPYLRARQTVEPLARAAGLTVRTRHELREWDSGLRPSPDYARQHARSWDRPALARPGGESLDQLTTRATAALGALARQYRGTVVVGSHGTFIARALTGFGLTTVDYSFVTRMPMPAVYRLCFGDGQVAIVGPGIT